MRDGAAAPLLRAEGLSFAAGGALRLDHIDLTLDGAGVAAALGANGAGKSLLLRLLHGLLAPSSGRVLWRGRPLDGDARRAQALVFQRPTLLRRSAAENIDFALRARGQPDARRRDALLAAVGLADKAAAPARKLSGGEQQRLAMARALAFEPELLLLDEPTASLDPASTATIERLARDAAAKGARVLFVTHDLAQARRVADEILFLHAGRLVERQAAPAFFAAPQSAPARAYVEGRLYLA